MRAESTLKKIFETSIDSSYIPLDNNSSNLQLWQGPRCIFRGSSHLEEGFNKFFRGADSDMQLIAPTVLLFALNLFDAVLTIVWVRSGVATESNQLMASLLDIGNAPFLIVKIAIGLVAAVVLSRWGNRRLARYGLAVALAVYIGLMGIHLFTGLSAFGYVSNTFLQDLQGQFFAFIF